MGCIRVFDMSCRQVFDRFLARMHTQVLYPATLEFWELVPTAALTIVFFWNLDSYKIQTIEINIVNILGNQTSGNSSRDTWDGDGLFSMWVTKSNR